MPPADRSSFRFDAAAKLQVERPSRRPPSPAFFEPLIAQRRLGEFRHRPRLLAAEAQGRRTVLNIHVHPGDPSPKKQSLPQARGPRKLCIRVSRLRSASRAYPAQKLRSKDKLVEFDHPAPSDLISILNKSALRLRLIFEDIDLPSSSEPWRALLARHGPALVVFARQWAA